MKTILALLSFVAVAAFLWSRGLSERTLAVSDEQPSASLETPQEEPSEADSILGVETHETEQRAAPERKPIGTKLEVAEKDPPVRISVFSTNRFTRGVAVPNVAFRIVGWSKVEVSEEVLVEGVTDSEGRAEVELAREIFERYRTRSAYLLAKAVQEGLQEKPFAIRKPSSLELPLEARVVAVTGRTIRGTLLDREGSPTTGKVQARRVNEERSRVAGGARKDGVFELHMVDSGSYVLTAQSDRGTAILGPVDIDLAQAPEPLEIRLVGPGAVRGRVLDASGQPASGLELLVLTAESDVGNGNFVIPKQFTERYKNEGAGHGWRTGTADPNGGFVFDGLRSGSFLVRARAGEKRGYPHLLTPSSVPADGVELSLRLDRPHLVVRVRPPSGEGFVTVKLARSSFFRSAFEKKWPEEPTLHLVAAPEISDSMHSRRRTPKGKSVTEEEIVFDLPVAGDYLLTLLAPGQAPVFERIAMSEQSGRVERILQLKEPLTPGTIEVEVFSPRGSPVRDDLSIRIQDPVSGAVLLERDTFYSGTAWPARFTLPPGDYELVVESIPFVDDHHGTLLTKRKHGDYRTKLSVRSGITSPITAQLSLPARIRLSIEGSATEADREAVRRKYASSLEGNESYLVGSKSWLAGYVEHVQVRLRRSDGGRTSVQFARHVNMGSATGTHLQSFLPLGSQETSEALPPGKYVLELELPGGRRAERAVELIGGQTLNVAFDLGGS